MISRSRRIAAMLICAALFYSSMARAQEASSIEDTAPIGNRQNFFSLKFREGSFRHMDRIFPFHVVRRGGPVSELARAERPLDITYQWKGGVHRLDELLALTKTTGFIVVKDGKIVDERYFGGANEASAFTSMSVAKSFTSTLVGLAIADGKINSIDQPITDYLPQLNGSGYEGVPIKSILQMSSGVKFSESYLAGRYSDMDIAFQRAMIDESEPLNDFMKALPRARPPGSRFVYKGADTQVLGWLVKRVTGETLADYLSEKIWQPMGMERDAFWNVDSPGPSAMEAAFTCLNATLRDYARFGLLFLNNGKWNGKQIVPADWVEQATAPRSPQVEAGHLFKNYPLGYGYQWWTFPTDRAFVAQGIYFQFIYVNPKENLVIVKTGAFDRAWDAALEAQIYASFEAIAVSLH